MKPNRIDLDPDAIADRMVEAVADELHSGRVGIVVHVVLLEDGAIEGLSVGIPRAWLPDLLRDMAAAVPNAKTPSRSALVGNRLRYWPIEEDPS